MVDKAILTGSGASGEPSSGVDEISGLSTTTYATAITNATIANVVAVEQALGRWERPRHGQALWVVAPRRPRAHFRTAPIGTGGIPAWYMGRLMDSPPM